MRASGSPERISFPLLGNFETYAGAPVGGEYEFMPIYSAGLACCLSVSVLFAAGDPFTGTWKLNLEKSRFPVPPPRALTVHIDVAENAMRVHETGTGAEGEPVDVHFQAAFDGKDCEVVGAPFADMVSVRRIDARTLEARAKKSGRVVLSEALKASDDGKSLTANFKAFGPDSQELSGRAVYDRQ